VSGIARVGIAGWQYPPWRGEFYPKGIPQREELAYAAGHLDSIEINGTFYSLQKPASFLRWRAETASDFVFSVKGGKHITHVQRLAGGIVPVANFFGSGVLALQEKLGPILWQLPPYLPFLPERLDAFLALLPHTTGEAKRMVEEHGTLDSDRVWLDGPDDQPIRHALEVRHDSYLTPAFAEILKARNVAAVVADTAGRWPRIREVTSDFLYLRLHGDRELYVSGYDDAAIDDWAAAIRGWLSGETCPDEIGRDVFVYFDNDTKVRAPFDAMSLRKKLGFSAQDPRRV
jgi:uncharacterized protein YecE (DUF72 family)